MREENLTLAEKMKRISIESRYGLFEREKNSIIEKIEKEAKKGGTIIFLTDLDREITPKIINFFKDEGFQINSAFVKDSLKYGITIKW